MFVPELGQCFRGVGAHPNHFRAKLVQFTFGITKLVSFARSTRCIRFREKIEDQGAAFIIAQLDGRTGIGWK